MKNLILKNLIIILFFTTILSISCQTGDSEPDRGRPNDVTTTENSQKELFSVYLKRGTNQEKGYKIDKKFEGLVSSVCKNFDLYKPEYSHEKSIFFTMRHYINGSMDLSSNNNHLKSKEFKDKESADFVDELASVLGKDNIDFKNLLIIKNNAGQKPSEDLEGKNTDGDIFKLYRAALEKYGA